eukprot:CAMPEP_0181538750 /NCGR_PEP_ID=MMETSP1110-20121109/76026_1 /TAXON_ID=174948 /ORGANISM="Symbiodinium sp., Strain CCMP421" /LENGTH=753 /DNA_ID=CAMNT_0023670359 /DNA_START=44 /DNA_END=2305 /DNA_ORIENTATION=-
MQQANRSRPPGADGDTNEGNNMVDVLVDDNNAEKPNAVEATWESIQAELGSQQEEIDALADQLRVLRRAKRVSAILQQQETVDELALLPGGEKIHMSFYVFEQSMWDAALLLCFHHTSCLDKLLLGAGITLNLALQLCCLLVVQYDMLENPFTDDKVQEILRWRVVTGHGQASFNDNDGTSLVGRLCDRNLWSYQQDQYDEMFEYLYKPMPGIVLSMLAIICWVLTIALEYRACLEQALAVLHLPTMNAAEEMATVSEDGQIIVKGISRVSRVLAILVLCIPRIAIMLWLGAVGCIYLAETVSLADIVLNAVALNFVLDVDELVAKVLLTEKLRSLIPKINPISNGQTTALKSWLDDISRYVMVVGAILVTVSMILVPFFSNVEAAAMALCGGYQDFSFSGGLQSQPGITLRPKSFGTDLFTPACFAANEDFYREKYYGLNASNSTHNRISKGADFYEELQKRHVMDFALSSVQGCPEGQMLGPPIEGQDARTCVVVPEMLLRSLPANNKVPGRSPPTVCPRFDGRNGCNPVALPEACLWTWLSQKCDGPLPGAMFSNACQEDYVTQCNTWEDFPGQHPTYNCQILTMCGEAELNCAIMRGSVLVGVNDTLVITDNLTVSDLTTSTIKNTLAKLVQTTDEYSVTVNPPTSSDNSLAYTYMIYSLPYTVLPAVVWQQNKTMADSLKAALKANPVLVLSAEFNNSEVLTQQALNEELNGGDDGDDGGYGGDDGDDGDSYGGDDGDAGDSYGGDGP